jgi:hypothetical protein
MIQLIRESIGVAKLMVENIYPFKTVLMKEFNLLFFHTTHKNINCLISELYYCI